jgi:hypothetical protein
MKRITATLITLGLVILIGLTVFTANSQADARQGISPAFSVHGGNTTASAPLSKVDLSTVNFDHASNVDTANDRFVAPTDGVYQFNGRISFAFPGDTNHVSAYLFVNGTFIPGGIQNGFNNGGPNTVSLQVGGTLELDAGDTVELWGARSIGSGNMNGHLSGHLVGQS